MILRYTILYVENVAAALDFYEKAFGLERLFLHESGDYGELATGETKLAFSSKTLMNQLGKSPGTPNRRHLCSNWRSRRMTLQPPLPVQSPPVQTSCRMHERNPGGRSHPM